MRSATSNVAPVIISSSAWVRCTRSRRPSTTRSVTDELLGRHPAGSLGVGVRRGGVRMHERGAVVGADPVAQDPARECQVVGVLVGFGGERPDADDQVRLGQHRRRREAVEVELRGDLGAAGVEVVGVGERDAEHARQLGAVARRSRAAPRAGSSVATGVARKRVHIPPSPRRSPSMPITSITSRGNCSTASCGWRPKAEAVIWSVPGARPMPRSIRPGCSASSRANCSAIASGAWLGSITPPDPTRIRRWRRRGGRSAPPVWYSRRSACCGARPPRTGRTRAARRPGPGGWCRPAPRPTCHRRATTDRSSTDSATTTSTLRLRSVGDGSGYGAGMAIAKVCGIETEYGIVVRGGDSNPVSASSLLINAYVNATSRKIGWDFEDETPANDARGFNLDDVFAPEIETSLVNAVLPNGARYYVDHAHPEISNPEVTTAAEAVRWDRAADEIVRASMEYARERAPRRRRTRGVQEQLRRQGQLVRLPRELPGQPRDTVRPDRRPGHAPFRHPPGVLRGGQGRLRAAGP